MEIQAAVIYHKGEKFKIEPVTLDEPKAGEVLVKMAASGICLTDIHVQNQEYFFPLPAVLGHEGSGIVEKVGEGVSTVKPGDPVVLGYAYCGKCQACLSGAPFECERLILHSPRKPAIESAA
ncbi:MAG: Aryl-alcohol dehydrogenase [Pelotomaculum sp. PtaU1.Bin035]|nr:MAG: Aryl-alcohol dehydrogenase [Pelotomaculum sp. PtaU1.Bin035]